MAQYRTVDDMYERGTLVQLTDRWTPALAQYPSKFAVVIDVEVIGFPRGITRRENGTTITEKYDCVYTVALAPEGNPEPSSREEVRVVRVISLDIERDILAEGELGRFAKWCIVEFCGSVPTPFPNTPRSTTGRFIAGIVMPHTIPMYEAQHRPDDHRRKSLAAIESVRQRMEQWNTDVIVLASTHWMPQNGFLIDHGAVHQDGCDSSYAGVEPQMFSFPGDPQLAALAAWLGQEAGLPVRRIHRVAQEHAVWVPAHLLCRETTIPVVPCSIWWGGSRENHQRWGEVLRDAVRLLDRRAVFVASGGLSHTFDFSQPPEYVVPAGERFDRLAIEWLEKGNHRALISMNREEFEAWNPEGRAGHLYMLRGALGSDLGGELLCYQGSNGTGYLTMAFQN